MPAAQLYMAGMEYSFNTHRMFFNRVTDTWLEEPSFETQLLRQEMTRIEDDQLYRVVTGMYSAQMLGTVKSRSLGLLSLVPKDENGQPITDWDSRILRDRGGNEIKEWYALAAYLRSFGADGVPDGYAKPDGRKEVSRSWNPVELLKSPNLIGGAGLLVLVLAVVLVVFLVRWAIRSRRRRRYGGGYGRRRWFG